MIYRHCTLSWWDEYERWCASGAVHPSKTKIKYNKRSNGITFIAVAKFGDWHYRVSKHTSKGRTRTEISPLDSNERQNEIARMLGGEKITAATLEHAKELLKK